MRKTGHKAGMDTALEAQLRAIIAEQAELIKRLTSRVEYLEAQLAKNSGNSGKPPSSDGLQKPAPTSQREKGKRKSGGQVGHIGTTLEAVVQSDAENLRLLPYRSGRAALLRYPQLPLHCSQARTVDVLRPCRCFLWLAIHSNLDSPLSSYHSRSLLQQGYILITNLLVKLCRQATQKA
jgi:hypothetical protein